MSFLLWFFATILHRFATIRTMGFVGASRFGASLCVVKFWRSCVHIYMNQGDHVHVWTLACNIEYCVCHIFACLIKFPFEVIVCVSQTAIGLEYSVCSWVWDEFICFDLKRVCPSYEAAMQGAARVFASWVIRVSMHDVYGHDLHWPHAW